MNVLRISLFGCVQVHHSDPAISTGKLTRVIQSLLAYLLLERHRLHSREALAGLFWSDSDAVRARNCLNTALWRLRHVLEPDGIPGGMYLLTNYQGDVGFNCASEHWLDVEVFKISIQPMLNMPPDAAGQKQIEQMEGALALYTGDLLEGFYEDWALREREHLRHLYLNGLAYLMRYYWRQRAFQNGLVCGQKILSHDPLREEIHRDMMRMYAESGQRSLALHQYDLCCAALDEELGVPAMEETRALHQQLLSDSAITLTPTPSDTSVALSQTIALFQQATQTLATAQCEFQQALRQMEALLQRRG